MSGAMSGAASGAASGARGRVVARIGKPHGIRGEVTVEARTDDPTSRFVPGASWATSAPPGSGVPRRLTLAGARLHRQTWLLAFEEIPDRTGAEGLRGTLLLLDPADEPAASASQEVPSQEVPSPEVPSPEGPDRPAEADDEEGFYEEELVGLAVTDPGGEPLGVVSGLNVGTAQDLLQVALTDGRTALVPFVTALVPVVDVVGGRVVVDAPPGLLDLAE